MHNIKFVFVLLIAAWQVDGLAQVAFLENIHWKDEWLLSGDNKLIGTVNATAPLDVKMKCEKELVSENTWEITWTFTAKRDVPNVRLTASFEHVSKPEWWMIPAVSYNGNQLSKGLELVDEVSLNQKIKNEKLDKIIFEKERRVEELKSRLLEIKRLNKMENIEYQNKIRNIRN